MATWESLTISDIVSKISDGDFLLPVIQRRLVWGVDKMELLFDTLLKGNSFGGIMVIEEERGEMPMFAHRRFSQDGTDVPSVNTTEPWSGTHHLVIDGQQRLQAFYIGLSGSFEGKQFYFDLSSSIQELEFEFCFRAAESTLPAWITDDSGNKRKPVWVCVPNLFSRLRKVNDDDQVADEYIQTLKISGDEAKGRAQRNIRKFSKAIFEQKAIGLSTVTVNKSLDLTANRQRIVELFQRLNDGGTRLSTFDLMASIMKGYAWEMEAFLDRVLKKYSFLSFGQDELIKLILLLQDNTTRDVASIQASDAAFATKNIDRIEATLAALEAFLHASRLIEFYRESGRSTIPLYFICYHIFNSKVPTEELKHYFDQYDTKNSDFRNLYRWVIVSLLNGVFRSRGAGWIPYKTGIRKILNVLKTHKGQSFPDGKLFNVYRNHPLNYFTTEIDSTSLPLLEQSVVFYLMYDGNRVFREQDIDHIHPTHILSNLGVPAERRNVLANYQLIESGTNRWEKKAKEFQDWVNTCVEDSTAYTRIHLIPNDQTLWRADHFETFSAVREQMIIEHLKRHL